MLCSFPHNCTNFRCCYYVDCHSAHIQANTVHTGRLLPLQYNPDTKTSPTNLLSYRKFLLNPFIALNTTTLVTLLERHNQCWTKQKAKQHQRRKQHKYYCHNNSTDGAKTKLVRGVVTCRSIAATTAATTRVSPCLASMMPPNNIAHCRRHSTRITAMLHHTLAPTPSQGAKEFKST